MSSLTGRYRAFLELPGTARALVSSLVARMPLGMMSLAIVLLVRQETGSFASAGFTVGACTLCSAAASPIQGAMVDRYGGRRVILPLTFANTAGLIGLVLAARAHAPVLVLVLIGGFTGAVIPPVDAVVRVLWPAVAPNSTVLESAYALDATSQEVIWTVGPLIVATVAAVASPSAAMLVSAAIGLGGALLFISGPLTTRRGSLPARRRRLTALGNPGLRVLLLTTALMGFGVGTVEIALPALAVHTGSRGAAGLLLAMWSLGSMLAGVLYGMRSWRSNPASRYPALLLLVAVTTAPLILAEGLAAAVVLSAVAGVGYAPMLACEYSLVNLVADRASATESFAWNSASLVAGIAAGTALSGAVVQRAGFEYSVALGCAATLMAALAAIAGRARVAAPTTADGAVASLD